MARALATASSTKSSSAGSTDSRYLSEPDDVTRTLKLLRDTRTALTLSFDGDPATYQARILDTSGEVFLLEDIVPRSGHQHLVNGQEFTATARMQGMYAYFAGNRVIECHAERGLPYYSVPLPKRLLFQQRRRAARFQIPLKVAGNGASLTLGGPRNIKGRVVDISAGGCRVTFPGPIDPPLCVNNDKEFCEIDVPKLLQLKATGVIRHMHGNRDGSEITCGIELVEMSVTDRRRLEQFIQSISRASQRA
ncbi:MAG: flagellar brake protein [Pseudomonadaceae bacterium]|nr:flagellar brake protein [Pseudomonadaceae bacterium]